MGFLTRFTVTSRNRKLAKEDPPEFDITLGLEAKFTEDSYQLQFVANTE